MRPAWNRALAVGALAGVTGLAFIVALTFVRRGGYSERDSYLVHAYFADATGVSWKTRAQIAGIQVGEIKGIELVGDRARIDIRIKKGIDLHTDACLTKTYPSALIPDALLEVQPGTPGKPLLSSLPEPDRAITCVREATSAQQLIDSLAKIAADVKLITGDLAETVGSNKSLRVIVENLASATKRIDDTIARNEQSFADIMTNTAAFTRDLREITGRDKEKIGRILSNVEALTARLNVISVSLQEIIDPGSSGTSGPGAGGAPGSGAVAGGAAGGGGKAGAAASAPAGGAPVAGVAGAVAAATPEERAAAAQEARGVKQAVDKLAGSLTRLEELITKVNEGKSVAGRLLVDERLGRKVGDAAENLADQLNAVFKLQFQVQLRSEWLLNQGAGKAYFGLRILPRPDKYYLIELVSDPRGYDSTTSDTVTVRDPATGIDRTTVSTSTHHSQKLTFSAQIAKRYGYVTFRGGIIESSGGVASDLHLFGDSLQLTMQLYQLTRPFESAYPRAKVYANYYFLQHFFATAGADDFLNTWREGRYPGGPKFAIGNDVFFGGGLFFTDDDLKTLIGAGAGSMASAR